MGKGMGVMRKSCGEDSCGGLMVSLRKGVM